MPKAVKKVVKNPISTNTPPAPKPAKPSVAPSSVKPNLLVKWLLFALVVLQCLIVAFILLTPRTPGTNLSSKTNSLIPVWFLIILVPILVKQKQDTAKSPKNWYWLALIGLGLFLLIGLLVFLNTA